MTRMWMGKVLLTVTAAVVLAKAEQLNSIGTSHLTPTSARMTLRGQGDGGRTLTSAFVSGTGPGTSGSFQTTVNLNGQSRTVTGRPDPLIGTWRILKTRPLRPPPSPPTQALPTFPPITTLPRSPLGLIPPPSSSPSGRILNFRLPSVSETLAQVLRATASSGSGASGQTSGVGLSSGQGGQRTGMNLGQGGQRAGMTLNPRQMTQRTGTTLTSGQPGQGRRVILMPGQAGQWTRVIFMPGQTSRASAIGGTGSQRTAMTLTSRPTSASLKLPINTAPLANQNQQTSSARPVLPEINAQSSNDLFNILRAVYRQAGSQVRPIFTVLQTADRVLNLLQNPAQDRLRGVEAPLQSSSSQSGKRPGEGTTQNTMQAGAGQDTVSSLSSSGTGIASASTTRQAGEGPIPSTSILLSQGVPVLTSTPQGVKVTVLNRANRIVRDLVAGYSLDLATNKIIHSVIDPVASRPAQSTGHTSYVVHVDPLLNILTLNPLPINVPQLLLSTLHQHSSPTGTNVSDLGTNIGGQGTHNNDLGTVQGSIPETQTGPQVSSEGFQSLRDSSMPSDYGLQAQGEGMPLLTLFSQTSGERQTSGSAGASSGGMALRSVKPENKTSSEEIAQEEELGRTTPAPSGTTTQTLPFESLWRALTSDIPQTFLSASTEDLQMFLNLLLKGSPTSTQVAESSTSTSSPRTSSSPSYDVVMTRDLTPDSASAGSVFV